MAAAVQGLERTVVVIGRRLVDEQGDIAGVEGFYVDLSTFRDEQLASDDAAVHKFATSRAVIEQVKGMLMLAYSIPADRAFDVIRWRSQNTNTKVQELCERVIARITEHSVSPESLRELLDHALLTAHEPQPLTTKTK